MDDNWPEDYKPMPPKAVIRFAAMTQENYDRLTARLTVLAGAAREAITAARRALPQSSTIRPEVVAAWTALDALAAALGAAR